MLFCDNEYLKIKCDLPISMMEKITRARSSLPSMSKEEIKDIQKKPFICTYNVNFVITDKRTDEEYRIFIPKSYSWDGATLPFGFRWMFGGKGNPKFLIASCVHDKLCECKWLVDNDRYLSSVIFRELLKACNCSNIKAQTMFLAVDNFQRFCGWEK